MSIGPREGGVQAAPGEIAGLIRKAKEYDRQAFAELYRFAVTPVYRYLAARVNRVEEAEELTQELFVAALSGIEGLRAEDEAGLLAWLFQIARHKLADHLRRRYRKPSASLEEAEEPEDPGPLPEEAALLGEERAEVRQALERLTPELVALVVLAGGGFGADRAAADSLPDSPLYGVKTAKEHVQLALARTPEAQVEVRANQLQERSKELDKALRAGKGVTVVDALAARVTRATEQMVDKAVDQEARGNRRPALRAAVAIRAMVAYADRLSGEAASPEVRTSLQNLRTFLVEQGRRLRPGASRNLPGAAAPAIPRTIIQ